MVVHAFCITFIICGFTLSTVNATLDPKRCTSRDNNLLLIKKEHCLVTKEDVKLICSTNEVVLVSSLQLAIKSTRSDCMKRILTRNDEVCCIEEPKDVLYDGHCLQGSWNKEDAIHYNDFMRKALERCMNTSQCVLNSQMFVNLQTEIPVTKDHASYFQVLYRCIPAPSNPIDYCSQGSRSGKDIQFQNRLIEPIVNKTCTCRVTSKSGGDVTVKAIDVRTTNSELILRSGSKTKNVSYEGNPLFGLRNILTEKKVDISAKFGSRNHADNIWLQATGSNGKDIFVSCGDTKPQKKSTSTLPARVATVTEETELWGYWPLIYVASGSLFTIVLVSIILGTLLICRYRRKRSKRRHPCGHPAMSYHGDFHHDPYGHQYASVMGDTLTLPRTRTVKPLSIHTLERSHDKQYMRTYPVSTSTRNIRPPSVPPPAPPNHPGSGLDTLATGTSSEVSELEAFLECKGQT